MVENIAQKFGEPLSLEGKTMFSFPSSDILSGASLDALKECKVGFRARYIKAAAENEPDWDKLQDNSQHKLGVSRGICSVIVDMHNALPKDIYEWKGENRRRSWTNSLKNILMILKKRSRSF